MRRKMTLLMAALPFLSGCAIWNAHVTHQAQDAMKQCVSLTHVETARCMNDAQLAMAHRIIPDISPYVLPITAARLRAAELQDAGKMTDGEANEYVSAVISQQMQLLQNQQNIQNEQFSHNWQNMMNNYYNATRPYNATPYSPSY